MAALRVWYVNTGMEPYRGGATPTWGLRIKSSLFTEALGSLTCLSMVPVPTPTLLQLERRHEGKGTNYISLQMLLFREPLWPNVRGPKAVPKAGGVRAS